MLTLVLGKWKLEKYCPLHQAFSYIFLILSARFFHYFSFLVGKNYIEVHYYKTFNSMVLNRLDNIFKEIKCPIQVIVVDANSNHNVSRCTIEVLECRLVSFMAHRINKTFESERNSFYEGLVINQLRIWSFFHTNEYTDKSKCLFLLSCLRTA